MVKIESLKDRLYMAPIKKYEKYGRFPYKMVIQILLVLFTSCQVLLIVNHSTTYSYSQYTLFNKLFLNKNVQGSDTTITNTYNIYGIPSFTNYIQTTVDRYYDINSHTIDNYNYNYDSDGLKHPPKLLFEYFDNTKAIESSSLIEYSLTTNNLGPFSQSDIKDFLNNVKNIHIKFSLIHKLDQYIDLPSQCYEWTIIQKYNYAQHGTIVAELSTDRHTCDTSDYNIIRNYIWVGLIVLFLAICSLIAVVKTLLKRAQIIAEFQGGPRDYRSAWENLGIAEKWEFFNYWVIISVVGNLFQIFAGLLSLIDENTVLKVHEVIIGFGCFFAWISLVRFINHTSHSYTIVNTVERSGKTIFLYIVGVVPIFMGYAFLAMSAFWETGIYFNTPMSLIANYALVNGDSVYAFSFAGTQESTFMGQLYYYTFIVFFICFVHNLFIAIIEEGFSSLRVNKPVQGDESSDEDLPQGAMSPRQISLLDMRQKKSNSIMAFKKILNVGRTLNDEMFDEKSLLVIQKMDQIVEEILSNLVSLQVLSHGSFGESAEISQLKSHLLLIVEEQLLPIIDYF